MILYRYHRNGTIEQLPDLAPELVCSYASKDQDWGDVSPTRLTLGSVSSLMKECRAYDVTFMIPRPDQRPWDPPIGYHCVYESFLGKDSKLLFEPKRVCLSDSYNEEFKKKIS